MTYCVALLLDRGLMFMSDTRTNSGVDDIATVRKMFHWSRPGERLITLMTAGNLATTQAVVALLDERTKRPDERSPSLLEVPTLFEAARLVGDTLKAEIAKMASDGRDAGTFSATIILGGQIAGMEPRLFMIYPEGNFIEASAETPYYQIGETKYGKPVLVRAFDSAMSFADAAKLLMLSYDSTLVSNLSVGLPLDLMAQETDRYEPVASRRVGEDDEEFRAIRREWSGALRRAFDSLPTVRL